MSDRSRNDDDDWWDDELLEPPAELTPEDEGAPSAEEILDEADDLLAPEADLAELGWDEEAHGEPPDADELSSEEDLLAPEDSSWRSWLVEEAEPEPTPMAPPPRRSKPTSPLAFVAAVRAPEPLVIGYRVPVDLPDHDVRGLPGRCHTHRSGSALRGRVLETGPAAAVVEVNGRELRLPAINPEGTLFAVRLRVAGRELEGKLSLIPSEAPPRLLLGRDMLAIGHFVVDVTRADS